MAKRRIAPRGRIIAAVVLAGFVLVSGSVIWRRSAGIAQANALRETERVRLQLEGDRAEARTTRRLGAIAEQRLGMRVPSDRQVVILLRSPGETR